MNARGKRKLVSSRISPRNSSLNNHGCGCRCRSPFPPPGEGAKCLAMIQVGLNSGDFHVNLLSFPSRGRGSFAKSAGTVPPRAFIWACPLPKNRHHFVLFIMTPSSSAVTRRRDSDLGSPMLSMAIVFFKITCFPLYMTAQIFSFFSCESLAFRLIAPTSSFTTSH